MEVLKKIFKQFGSKSLFFLLGSLSFFGLNFLFRTIQHLLKNKNNRKSISIIPPQNKLFDELIQAHKTKIVEGLLFGSFKNANQKDPIQINGEKIGDKKFIIYKFIFMKSSKEPTEYFFCIQWGESDNSIWIETAFYNVANIDNLKKIHDELSNISDKEKSFGLIKNYINKKLIEPIIDEESQPDSEPVEQYPSSIVGSGYVDSQPDMAFKCNDLDIESYSSAIGYLCGQDGANICTAFLVHHKQEKNIIMTARHALNERVVEELKFSLPNLDKEFSISEIIELGDQFIELDHISSNFQKIMPDYALLKINNDNRLGLTYLTLASDDINVQPDLYEIVGCDKGGFCSSTVKFENSGNQQELVLTYFADDIKEGFSGAPFIDINTGSVVGIHCKTTLQPIAENQKTGFKIKYFTDAHPESLLSKLVRGDGLIPTLRNYSLATPLSNVTSVIEGLLEREQGLRNFALPPTPKLSCSHTYRCLLARWLLKGDEKIKFVGVPNDQTSIDYDSNKKTYTIKIGRSKVGLEITEQDLHDQACGKSILANATDEKIKLKTVNLLNRFFSPEYWQVNVKKSNDPNSHTRQWVALTEKHGNQPAINMGHKLGAVEYWLQGSENYQSRRLEEKEQSQKYINSKTTLKLKTEQYRQRYQKYKESGYLTYGTSINEKFMNDPYNYRFEWHGRNKSGGARDKIGNYADQFPPGLQNAGDKFTPK